MDIPYLSGNVKAYAMKNCLYDLVIGNVDGVRQRKKRVTEQARSTVTGGRFGSAVAEEDGELTSRVNCCVRSAVAKRSCLKEVPDLSSSLEIAPRRTF